MWRRGLGFVSDLRAKGAAFWREEARDVGGKGVVSRALESGPDHVWAPRASDWARNVTVGYTESIARPVGPPRSGPLIFCSRFSPVVSSRNIQPNHGGELVVANRHEVEITSVQGRDRGVPRRHGCAARRSVL
jgi:hypothetical protein